MQTAEKMQQEIINGQNEMIELLKQMVESKDKHIESLERLLDIQDNHIAEQNEIINDYKQSFKTVEKELFTEDDVRKAIVLSRDLCREQHIDGYDEYTYSKDKIIEQLKQYKTK